MLSATRIDIRPFEYRVMAPSTEGFRWPIHRARTAFDAATGPIVVGLDMTPECRRAVEDAAGVATSTGVPLHLVLSVRKQWSIVVSGHGEAWNLDVYSVARQFLDSVISELPITGVTRTITSSAIGQAVRREAIRLDSRMVVVRAHRPLGRCLSRLRV